MNECEEVGSSNPAKYWDLIKVINNNTIISNKTSEIDSFNYFKTLSNEHLLIAMNKISKTELINGFAELENDILDNSISEAEVDRAVKFLKNKRALIQTR